MRDASTYGVLKLTLHPEAYDWQFLPVAGGSFTDSGSDSCDPDGTTPTDPVPGPPNVISTSPANKSTQIAPTANLTATFSEKMDPASITNSTFKLFKVNPDGSTMQITNVTVSPSTDGLNATLDPFGSSASVLSRNTKYKGVITTGAKDVAGNQLDQNTTTTGFQQKGWTFTVSP